MSGRDLKYSKLPGYLSISSLLAGATYTDCRTLQTIPKHGWMDPSSSDVDLPANMELKLPLWLVHAMSFQTNKPTVSASRRSEMQLIIEECKTTKRYDIDASRIPRHCYESLILHIFSILEKREIAKEMVEEVRNFFFMRSAWFASSFLFPTGDIGAQPPAALGDGVEWEHELYKSSLNVFAQFASYLRVFAPDYKKHKVEVPLEKTAEWRLSAPLDLAEAEVKVEAKDHLSISSFSDSDAELEEELSAPPFSPLGWDRNLLTED